MLEPRLAFTVTHPKGGRERSGICLCDVSARSGSCHNVGNSLASVVRAEALAYSELVQHLG